MIEVASPAVMAESIIGTVAPSWPECIINFVRKWPTDAKATYDGGYCVFWICRLVSYKRILIAVGSVFGDRFFEYGDDGWLGLVPWYLFSDRTFCFEMSSVAVIAQINGNDMWNPYF